MASTKMLFNAVEAEMRNARVAINNASAYMDMIKDTVKGMEKSSGRDAPLSVSRGKPFTDLMVKTGSGEYGIPLTIDSDDETLMYGFKIRGVDKEPVSSSEIEAENLLKMRDVNKRLKEYQKLL